MLTVIRLDLPRELRRSLACTNTIESLIAVIRQVCRNVKRWRNARMALRWTGTAMLEAKKTFRRLKAYRQLSMLRAALNVISTPLRVRQTFRHRKGRIMFNQRRLPAEFQQRQGQSRRLKAEEGNEGNVGLVSRRGVALTSEIRVSVVQFRP